MIWVQKLAHVLTKSLLYNIPKESYENWHHNNRIFILNLDNQNISQPSLLHHPKSPFEGEVLIFPHTSLLLVHLQFQGFQLIHLHYHLKDEPYPCFVVVVVGTVVVVVVVVVAVVAAVVDAAAVVVVLSARGAVASACVVVAAAVVDVATAGIVVAAVVAVVVAPLPLLIVSVKRVSQTINFNHE